MQKRTYIFNPILKCNMCGDNTDSHKVLGQRLNQSQGFRPKSKTGISTSIMKCRQCGLIYSNPQPEPASLQDHYSLSSDEYWKDKYEERNQQQLIYQTQKTKVLLPFKPGMKSLDIGSGQGDYVAQLKDAGFDAYGLEASQLYGAQSIEKYHFSENDIKIGMLEEVEYPRNYFDFITFNQVLEHLYDPSRSIGVAMSWLKPGGLIYIQVPSAKQIYAKFVNLYFRLARTNYVTHLSPMHAPFHLYEFTKASFEKHASSNQYKIELYESPNSIQYLPYLPKMIKSLLSLGVKKIDGETQLAIWLRKNIPGSECNI